MGSYFDVSFQPGGGLKDVYTARKKDFSAEPASFTMGGYVVPGTGNARWRESPFWPLYLSYLILYVDPEDRTALVGYPGRGYGWILARQPVIDDFDLRGAAELDAGPGLRPGPVPPRPANSWANRQSRLPITGRTGLSARCRTESTIRSLQTSI